MCFHLSMSQSAQTLKNRFGASFADEALFEPNAAFNAFAHPLLPVITQRKPGAIQLLHWGLVPDWVKDAETAERLKKVTLNARSETVFDKPSFRESIRYQRCLIPVDAFYEWQHVGKDKLKYKIATDRDIFCFAGIYDIWQDWRGFSILTTVANPLMETIHNTQKRMPVILSAENEKAWLDPNMSSPEELTDLFDPYPEDRMRAERV